MNKRSYASYLFETIYVYDYEYLAIKENNIDYRPIHIKPINLYAHIDQPYFSTALWAYASNNTDIVKYT